MPCPPSKRWSPLFSTPPLRKSSWAPWALAHCKVLRHAGDSALCKPAGLHLCHHPLPCTAAMYHGCYTAIPSTTTTTTTTTTPPSSPLALLPLPTLQLFGILVALCLYISCVAFSLFIAIVKISTTDGPVVLVHLALACEGCANSRPTVSKELMPLHTQARKAPFAPLPTCDPHRCSDLSWGTWLDHRK